MSIINHLNDTSLEKEIIVCPVCKKTFRCVETEQTPGFRSKDYKNCPYCKAELESSMEYEFGCYKLTTEEISYLKSKGIVINQEETDNG